MAPAQQKNALCEAWLPSEIASRGGTPRRHGCHANRDALVAVSQQGAAPAIAWPCRARRGSSAAHEAVAPRGCTRRAGRLRTRPLIPVGRLPLVGRPAPEATLSRLSTACEGHRSSAWLAFHRPRARNTLAVSTSCRAPVHRNTRQASGVAGAAQGHWPVEAEGLVATGTANDAPAPLVPCLPAAAQVEAEARGARPQPASRGSPRARRTTHQPHSSPVCELPPERRPNRAGPSPRVEPALRGPQLVEATDAELHPGPTRRLSAPRPNRRDHAPYAPLDSPDRSQQASRPS
jgi:hypothetical protein